jgi:small subunit ribosomal protein S8e
VVYNGANNEFVRTNTLVRGEVVSIDATPFRLWWETYYGVPLKKSKKVVATKTAATAKPKVFFF